jgi:cyclic beta-1,2-glucan synthetase
MNTDFAGASSSALVSSPAPSFFPLLEDDQEPIRAERYGPEALEAYARQLAAHSVRIQTRSDDRLPLRLEQNGQVLRRVHGQLFPPTRPGCRHAAEPLPPDAEQLLDNFHVVEDALREVRQDLPRGYYRELPRLTEGPLAGYPRVYVLALAVIAHTDSRLEEDALDRFVQAYQTVAPLTIGELWAVPIMLRLGLLENLRRLAEQLLAAQKDRHRADEWAAGPAASFPEGFVDLPPPNHLTAPFLVGAFRALRDRGSPEAAKQLRSRLAARGVRVNELMKRERRRRAVNQVSVGNCVNGLRLLATVDWMAFFERANRVEIILRGDPAGVYSRQDFATRNRYRQIIEKLARRSGRSEEHVARQVLALARAGETRAPGDPTPSDHVGYYLIDEGGAVLRAELGYRPDLRERLLGAVLAHPRLVYFGTIVSLIGLFLIMMVFLAGASWSSWPWLLLVLVCLLPASELAVFLTNDLLRQLLPPRVLPKLELKEGIPADCGTFVVIPCLLARPDSAAELLERLETHYLANPDAQLRFGLLTDFTDAPAETMPDDGEILRAALDGVKELNRRYSPEGEPLFFLFHRRRGWNPSQGCWMGWERKRGKLLEFNRLLRGDRSTTYAVCSSHPSTLPKIRFIITLDSDTRLPREAARRLVGTLAHPLNRARFDPERGRVVAGHGVLQPRISYHVDAAHRSLLTRIWAASAGVDPYAMAVSDTYQDLFGTGTFTGKGIYDVDAFEKATGPAFPDNHILSHDLIEGSYARCGLVTDIELFDDFPSRYHAYARREHRWVRGDWQLLPWMGRTVPGPRGRGANPLPLLERWKIFDNLRRSLVPPSLVLLLVLGWTVLPGSAWLWSGAALVVMTAPLLHHLFTTLVHAPRTRSLTGVIGLRHSAPATTSQVLLGTIFVADQARLALDAVLRTLVRLYLTRRRLLEWETAAATEARLGTGLAQFCRSMWPVPLLALGCALLVAMVRPPALAAAGPLLLAWLLSPLVAFRVSRHLAGADTPLDEGERRELRVIARKTWGFFETFVGDQDHWLPPDNFQEDPDGRVAHRTSPTNKGLLLLSTLGAHDLGYLSFGTLLHRLEKTFATLEQLERYRGHFYNWYDTLTLQPLKPAYVSTVDSANLVGCLIALKQGLLEKVCEPWPGKALAEGLADTFGIIEEHLRSAERLDNVSNVARRLWPARRNVDRLLREIPRELTGWRTWLGQVRTYAEELERALADLGDGDEDTLEGLQVWVRRFAAQVSVCRSELDRLAPWLALLSSPKSGQFIAALSAESEAVAPRWTEVYRRLTAVASVSDFELGREKLLADLAQLRRQVHAGRVGSPVAEWLEQLAGAVHAANAASLGVRCRELARRADALAMAADFTFLYKPEQHLFAVGYTPAQRQLDAASYDLLASEARLASFLSVARGQAPCRHWFKLGRPLTRVNNQMCLVSWGGTMFEYLMPELVMPCYPGTLLEESRRAAVARQIEYGEQRGVPWGISESAFSSQNCAFEYHYQSFGVPGLGLKRGLADDLVIAPYATALAATVRPRAALANYCRLIAEGAVGPHGFYEAIDYTANRLPEGCRSLVVRSYMAHHQGMSLVALTNCLLRNPMPRRFRAEPMVRATELLLQERVPRSALFVKIG